jgi:hypothetical protein
VQFFELETWWASNVGIQVRRLEPRTRKVNVKVHDVKVQGTESKMSESQ